MTFTRRRLITLFIAMATFVAVLAPTSVQATHDYGYKAKRELTVMSRNLYLGASLDPALAATSSEEFQIALFGILGEFEATDYAARSGALADEILATQPDLIGLQEVATWTFATEQGPVVVDFLAILQQQLKGRGLYYEEAATSNNADIEVPNAVRFQDRDVILVNSETVEAGLVITDEDSGRYSDQLVVPLPGLPPESFDRGWTYIDGRFQGRNFRFINTHLEVEIFGEALEVFGQIQEKQAAEFLAGPARKRGTVIAVGDFNSAADGSTTDTYRMLTKRWQFRDAWRGKSRNQGLTCCFDSALADSSSELSSRIDLVLVKGWAGARPASVIGDEPFQDSAPYWASDHAGVVATIRLF